MKRFLHFVVLCRGRLARASRGPLGRENKTIPRARCPRNARARGPRHFLTGLSACIIAAFASLGCEPGGMGMMPGALEQEDQYTLLLTTLTGSDHVNLADLYLQRTKQYTQWQGLYVVNKDDSSALYWGRYRTAPEAMRNLQTAKQYVTPATGENIFRMATIVPLPGKDVGPPEWNLKNAQGEYTVLVAVFQDLPQQNYFGRKGRAVDLCKKLREQGQEAYFLHDVSRSGVTLGSFPAQAVQTQRVPKRHPQTGDTFYEDLRVVVDPKMKAILKANPEFLYCGNTEIRMEMDPQTGKMVRRVSPSVPMSIGEFKKGQMNIDAFHRSGNP
ncbi:MAG: hypothetical protein JW849_02235 [Phycisphaerae bacterium]|nr:hypothetical protein [Phycisphaerae bacterium]